MHWVWGVLFSDVLTFLSFPPFPLGPIMLVGLVPLFIALERATSWRQAFFRAWVYVFIGNSAICFWVGPTIQEFARVSPFLSYPSVAVLSFVEQSAWPVMAALRYILHRRMGIRPLLWTPACLMVLDAAWPKFFPNSMGNVFYSVPWLAQFADVAGVWGLTALIVLTNEIVALWWVRSWPKAELRRHSWVAGGVVLLVFSYSTWRYFDIQRRKVSPLGTLKVAVVQPNINPIALVRESSDKHGARYKHAMPLVEMSRMAVKENRPALLFWPETSVSNAYASNDPRETLAVTRAIDEMVKETETPLLFGARAYEGEALFNALFLVSAKDGSLGIQRYYKHHLLWIGEYMPLSTTFPEIAAHIRRQGGTTFTPGKGPSLFTLGNLKLGPMICLEGLYSPYVRDTALAGADILVNATNDAWFGQGMEPALHLYLTSFRSIETRRPMVRSTTTGHSAVIGIDGKLELKTAIGEKGVFTYDVPYYPAISSPYLFWGLAPVWVALGWMLFAIYRGFRKKREGPFRAPLF